MYIHTCIYTYIYLYMYIVIHIYIHINIHIYNIYTCEAHQPCVLTAQQVPECLVQMPVTHEGVMSRTSQVPEHLVHTSRMKDACHVTRKRVMLHIQMSHVAYERVISRINESYNS